MPRFSDDSFSKLTTCHGDLQTLFFEVVKSFDCTILQGYRNEIEQEQDYKNGKTKLHFPHGKHNHQPSFAVDCCPNPIPDWSKIEDFIYFGGYVMGIAQRLKDEGKITHALRFGGDWACHQRVTDNKFGDYVHFELIL